MNRLLISLALCLCVALVASESVKFPGLSGRYSTEEVRNVIKQFGSIIELSKKISVASGDALTVKCAICGIVVNELEGILVENRSLSDIKALFDKDVCQQLPQLLQEECKIVGDAIPDVLHLLESKYTVRGVCTEIKLCTQNGLPTHNITEEIPTFVINLDSAPEDRLTEVCSDPKIRYNGRYLISSLEDVFGDTAFVLDDIGKALNELYFPYEYAQEIKGCAAAMNVSYGYLSVLNLGYEIGATCTSIVAQTTSGDVLHARNMDFPIGMGFTDILRDILYQADYQRGGKTVFYATNFAGYAGVLSGHKPGEFSVTIDTRFFPKGITQMFYDVIDAIENTNATLVSFLSRDVFMKENDFAAAKNSLSNGPIVADVYYIMAGKAPGEGCVISRNRQNATNVWNLSAPDQWFILETNFDHWQPAPWWDDRRDPGMLHMRTLGRDGLTLDGMFKHVLSQKPTLNLQTVYSILSQPKTGYYHSFRRYCDYPCVQ